MNNMDITRVTLINGWRKVYTEITLKLKDKWRVSALEECLKGHLPASCGGKYFSYVSEEGIEP